MREDEGPPVKAGDELQSVLCIAVGEKGDGICKHKGFVLIVKEAVAGKRYDLQVETVKEKYGFAKILRPENINSGD